MKKILISVGTRPNIIKITQFKKLAPKFGLEVKLLHTGQHYDHKMAQVFYDQLEVQPDFVQSLTNGSKLNQMTQMMGNVESVLEAYQPEIVLTPGDVNSTFAAAFAAYNAGIPVGHIESGLRSGDRTMPEEVNRVLTDEITDHFFITEKSGLSNLELLGKSKERLHFVGNTMIDTLVAFDSKISESDITKQTGVTAPFILFTFHRPGNVDNTESLQQLVKLLSAAAEKHQVVFPIHPRTLKMLKQAKLEDQLQANANIFLLEPLDYFSFQKLIKDSMLVVTDSGGIQEETTFRKVPCLTIRPNTERPITIDEGSNTLLPFQVDEILEHVEKVAQGEYKTGQIPALWDGKSTERILDIVAAL